MRVLGAMFSLFMAITLADDSFAGNPMGNACGDQLVFTQQIANPHTTILNFFGELLKKDESGTYSRLDLVGELTVRIDRKKSLDSNGERSSDPSPLTEGKSVVSIFDSLHYYPSRNINDGIPALSISARRSYGVFGNEVVITAQHRANGVGVAEEIPEIAGESVQVELRNPLELAITLTRAHDGSKVFMVFEKDAQSGNISGLSFEEQVKKPGDLIVVAVGKFIFQ